MSVCAACGHEIAESAKFCAECGAPVAPASVSREQRKTVTVLFCDLAGSSALGESTDPEALRSLLARYFDRMKAIVERHGGTVEARDLYDQKGHTVGVAQADAMRAELGATLEA